jgi:MoaA/NifB/PqqE/SkfB family radical SAM enzyme
LALLAWHLKTGVSRPKSQGNLMEKESNLPADHDIDRLARIYVEPTNRCNLDCRTCMRHGWEEPLGYMEFGLFEKIAADLDSFPGRPGVFFGGFGEPLGHPSIVEMVKAAKLIGSEVELISNGILLDEEMAGRLAKAGLDRLWVSIDGASPASYADVRWDGHIGPCLPLLHTHTVCLNGHSRAWSEFHFDTLAEHPLKDIWSDPAAAVFRRKLEEFSFSPCTTCNSCDLPSVNGEDCFGNAHPACGGCLWSQGFIQCP